MHRQILNEVIFTKTKRIGKYTESEPFTWGEIKRLLEEKGIELQDDDFLSIGYREEEHSHEDAYAEAHYYVEINRKRLQTDEECKEYLEHIEKMKKDSEERQRALYEKLKKYYETGYLPLLSISIL